MRAGAAHRELRLDLRERVQRENGTQIEVCPARDAVVLKALALMLTPKRW